MRKLRIAGIVACLCWAGTTMGQAVNGTLVGDESLYGAALSVQNTDTHFGNAINGDPRYANGGSEIDQVFGTIRGGRLYMLFTGNLESNFNKLEIFIDSVPGTGVNSIVGASLPTTVDGYCCNLNGGNPPNLPDPASGALQRMDGLTFDAGFTADRYLTFSNGNEGLPNINSFWALTAHFADLTMGVNGVKGPLGMQLNPFGQEPGLLPGVLIDQNNNGWNGPDDPLGSPAEHRFVEPVSPGDTNNDGNHRDMTNIVDLRMAINNSNIGGVNGSGGPIWDNTGDPQNVVTGLEFSIPLSHLGIANGAPVGPIKVAAFINGGGHDYASNQFIGLGLAGATAGGGTDGGNPGGDGFGGFTGTLSGVNLANMAGNQFVTINAPATVSCDIDGDSDCDFTDLRRLYDGISAGTTGGPADLDGSGLVDNNDIDDFLSLAGVRNSKTYRPGDANLDGNVGGADFTALASGFGGTGLPGAYWDQGNFDGNTGGSFTVGGADFTALASNFGATSVAAVPEPGCGVAMAMALLGLCFGRSRRR